MNYVRKNIYTKMQEARIRLQATDLKKSGENKFSNYNYFELGDFLPDINKINQILGLYTEISFDNDFAVLKIINADNPEEVRIFTSPMRNATLKGCHEIQNLGAVETYQRRYLYVMAYEIVEADMLEAITGQDAKKSDGNLSDGQIKRLLAIASKNNYTEETVKKAAKKYYQKEVLKTLTKAEYDDLVSKMDQPKK